MSSQKYFDKMINIIEYVLCVFINTIGIQQKGVHFIFLFTIVPKKHFANYHYLFYFPYQMEGIHLDWQ